jgi:hypothetical protein
MYFSVRKDGRINWEWQARFIRDILHGISNTLLVNWQVRKR